MTEKLEDKTDNYAKAYDALKKLQHNDDVPYPSRFGAYKFLHALAKDAPNLKPVIKRLRAGGVEVAAKTQQGMLVAQFTSDSYMRYSAHTDDLSVEDNIHVSELIPLTLLETVSAISGVDKRV